MVENIVNNLAKQYGSEISSIETHWSNSELSFSLSDDPVTIKGRFEIGEKEILLTVDLPVIAKPFEGQIRVKIEQLLDNYLI